MDNNNSNIAAQANKVEAPESFLGLSGDEARVFRSCFADVPNLTAKMWARIGKGKLKGLDGSELATFVAGDRSGKRFDALCAAVEAWNTVQNAGIEADAGTVPVTVAARACRSFKDERAMYEQTLKDAGQSGSWLAWRLSQFSTLAIIRGQIVAFDKPSIQTSFYFPEYGHDFEEKQELVRKAGEDSSYFLKNNLEDSRLPQLLEWARAYRDSEDSAAFVPLLGRDEYTGTAYVSWVNRFACGEDGYVKLTSADMGEYIDAAERALAAFEKRLGTYLKRYGLSKCTFSTFWGDR